MADPTLYEMMSDLAAADAAGDTELAQHIAGKIRAQSEKNPVILHNSLGERIKTGFVKFFDPTYGHAGAGPGDIAKQIAKAASFMVPGYGIPSMAASGALMGAGTTDAQDASGVAQDALYGAGGAALLGGAVKAASAVARPVGKYLGGKAIDYGRKAITGVSSPLAAKAPLAPEVVENAFNLGAIKPLLKSEGIAARLDAAAQGQAQQYAAILEELAAKGVHGPEAQALAQRYLSTGREALQNSLGSEAPGHFKRLGEEVLTKTLPEGSGGRLGLMNAEAIKRNLQHEAMKEYSKLEGQSSVLGETKKESASIMRAAIEKAVREQAAKAPEAAAAFEPVKQQLHLTLSALDPAKQAAARSARRIPFGLHEAMGMASGIASGNPGAVLATPVLMNTLKERGASTLASAARGGSKVFGGLGRVETPAALGTAEETVSPGIKALIDALRSKGYLGVAPAAGEEEQ